MSKDHRYQRIQDTTQSQRKELLHEIEDIISKSKMGVGPWGEKSKSLQDGGVSEMVRALENAIVDMQMAVKKISKENDVLKKENKKLREYIIRKDSGR